MIWLALLLSLLLPLSVDAAAIDHASVSMVTNRTTNSTTFVDVTGATISSASFTSGQKYLVYVTAQCGWTTSDGTEVRMTYGSTPTAFAGSESWIEPTGTAGSRESYSYATVWTAGASEGLQFQYRSRTGGANTGSCNFVHIQTLRLSQLTENVHWQFNEVTADDAMSTSWEDGATVSWTPATGAHDWLVIGCARTDSGNQATNLVRVRLTDGTNVVPQDNIDIWNNALDEQARCLVRVYTLAASSQTIKVQYSVSASTTGNHLNSTIVAIDLHQFKDHSVAYTEAEAALSASAYATEAQTVALTPTVTSDVWIVGYVTFDGKASNRVMSARLQVGDSDAPAGQTSAAYAYQHTNDQGLEAWQIQTMLTNQTGGSPLDIDLDASVNSATSSPGVQERTLMAVTMELASTERPGRGSRPMVFP